MAEMEDLDTNEAHDRVSPDEHPAPAREAEFVPAWLAVLVLVLLLGVVGVGGYAIRGIVTGGERVVDVTETAVTRWKSEVKANPDDVQARLQLGYAYQEAGRYDKAVDQYQYVIEKDPSNTAAKYNLGVVYMRLGFDDKAEQAFWDVLDVTPDHVLAAKALGDIYAEQKHYRSLLRAVRPVVGVHPEIADLQYLTGLAYENLNHPDWAKARYRLALKYAPDYQKARDGLDRLGEVE